MSSTSPRDHLESKRDRVSDSLPVATSEEQDNDKDVVPDGGTLAWFQVLGSFFLFFNTWGIINSYGVFQTYYEEALLSTSTSSAIAWIGSIQSFLIMFVGVITGPVYDAGHFRPLLLVGTSFVVVGHMLLSISTEYWQIMLAQGVCVALGSGSIFVPGVAILSTYFKTKISFAVGIAASGSSLGGVIYPIIFHRLQPRLGFGWTVRIIGFIALFGLMISIASMRMRQLPARRRQILDWTAFRELPYVLFVTGIFLAFMGLYVPFYYIQVYAIDTGVTNINVGFYLLPILNAASTFGRIIPNYLAGTIGPFNIMVFCATATSVLIFCLLTINHLGSLIVFCILYGFFSGSFVSLMPSILVALSPTPGTVGTRMGMCFTIVAFGLLLGTPIAGAIVGSHGYCAVWIYGGAFTAVGTTCVCWARSFQARWKLSAKI